MSSSSSSPPQAESETTDLGAKETVKKIWGPELGERLARIAGRGKVLAWRKLLEPVDPVSQCGNVVGTSEKTELCYLCGETLLAKNVFGRKTIHPLYPECEHILPVTSARWYLDLYMRKTQMEDPFFAKMLALEYAWAHRVCNQTKSNTLFLTELKSGETQTDSETIKQTLSAIRTNAKDANVYETNVEGAADILNNIANMNIEIRTGEVSKIIQGIVDELNKQPYMEGGLLVLSRAAFLSREDHLSDDIKKAINDFRESKRGELDSYPESVSSEIVRNYAKDCIPDYTVNGASKLFQPFASLGIRDSAGIFSIFKEIAADEILNAEDAAVNAVLDQKMDTLDPGKIDVAFAIGSLYQLGLYTRVWNAIVAGVDKKMYQTLTPLLCTLRNLLTVLEQNASPIGTSTVPRDATKDSDIDPLCAAYDAKRADTEDKIARHLNNMSDRQFTQTAISDEEKDTDRKGLSAVVAYGQEVETPEIEEDFFEPIPEFDDMIDEFYAMFDAFKELRNVPDTGDERTKNLGAIQEIQAKIVGLVEQFGKAVHKRFGLTQRTGLPTGAVSHYSAQLNKMTAESKTLAPWVEYYQTAVALRTRSTVRGAQVLMKLNQLTGEAEEDLKKFLESDGSGSSSSSSGTQGGRKTKRAKLSPRTKRARRSGPSTKLRRRSFRKSRMGKLTKRSRY